MPLENRTWQVPEGIQAEVWQMFAVIYGQSHIGGKTSAKRQAESGEAREGTKGGTCWIDAAA